MATATAAADSDSGKKWGKLNLTDAIKTAKVPRLVLLKFLQIYLLPRVGPYNYRKNKHLFFLLILNINTLLKYKKIT